MSHSGPAHEANAPPRPSIREAWFLLTDAPGMKMLLVVFRNSIEDEVLGVLRGIDVDAFTDVPKVYGVGDSGRAFHSYEWPGFNSLVFAGLDDEAADRTVDALRAFRDAAAAKQRGANVPLRVFVLPCTQAL